MGNNGYCVCSSVMTEPLHFMLLNLSEEILKQKTRTKGIGISSGIITICYIRGNIYQFEDNNPIIFFNNPA